jgi:GT2 family glycosyltransferase
VRPREVSVAILSWNGRPHLETCLAALAAQRDPGVPWEIVVLDNGSTDGTSDWVRRAHPRVRLVRSEANLGFCAGNNRLAAEAGGDAIAFLNNDTRPDAGWLRALVAALAAAPSEVAAVSGMIVDWAGERLDFAQGVMTFDGHALQPGFRRPLARAAIPAAGSELLFACGGNMLVRRAAFAAAGGFDEDYFAYYEDVDFGWRLWAGGERVVFTPDAVVHHRSSATSDLLGLYNRGFLFERNAFLTAYKNFEAGLWERIFPAVLLTLLARTQTLLVENNPGGETLRLDPFAGLIANTAAGARSAAAAPPAAPEGLYAKWRRYGPREFVRRAAARAGRALAASSRGPAAPCITDERTVAQLRAVGYLLRHLERAAEKRAAAQARRRVGDREIFARFPLHLVPTYPGDAELFSSPGFRAWLPPELPLVERRLDEIMSLD